MSQQMSLPPPKKQRDSRRSEVACQICRKRKIKCGGGEVCSNCFANKIPCIYTRVTPEENMAARERKMRNNNASARRRFNGDRDYSPNRPSRASTSPRQFKHRNSGAMSSLICQTTLLHLGNRNRRRSRTTSPVSPTASPCYSQVRLPPSADYGLHEAYQILPTPPPSASFDKLTFLPETSTEGFDESRQAVEPVETDEQSGETREVEEQIFPQLEYSNEQTNSPYTTHPQYSTNELSNSATETTVLEIPSGTPEILQASAHFPGSGSSVAAAYPSPYNNSYAFTECPVYSQPNTNIGFFPIRPGYAETTAGMQTRTNSLFDNPYPSPYSSETDLSHFYYSHSQEAFPVQPPTYLGSFACTGTPRASPTIPSAPYMPSPIPSPSMSSTAFGSGWTSYQIPDNAGYEAQQKWSYNLAPTYYGQQ